MFAWVCAKCGEPYINCTCPRWLHQLGRGTDSRQEVINVTRGTRVTRGNKEW